MSRQLPLSRRRLHEILTTFEPGVTMTMVGGYDTGVYFSFQGRRRVPRRRDGSLVGGRVEGSDGFSSEALFMTRSEHFSRGGPRYGIERFFARCKVREDRLRGWLDDFVPADRTADKESRS